MVDREISDKRDQRKVRQKWVILIAVVVKVILNVVRPQAEQDQLVELVDQMKSLLILSG